MLMGLVLATTVVIDGQSKTKHQVQIKYMQEQIPGRFECCNPSLYHAIVGQRGVYVVLQKASKVTVRYFDTG